MNVLIYDRLVTKDFFHRVASEAFPSAKIVGVSEFHYCTDYWVGDWIYKNQFDFSPSNLNETAIEDIISRDRTLRCIGYERARQEVVRYWNGLQETILRESIDVVLSPSIDCFLIDVLYRVAQLNHIPCISWIGSFMRGYARFTLRGELIDLHRSVSNDEAERVLQTLMQKKYLPDSERKNITRDHSYIYKFYIRRMAIEKILYPTLRFIESDKDNNHYGIQTFYGLRFSDIYDSDFERRFVRINNIVVERTSAVYFPLHLIPEATTDYWLDGVASQGYENYVLNIIKTADAGITFIVKEHPAMYGRRRLRFYDELNSLDNVILLHPMDSSNDLLELVDNVAVDNGTVGVEAALKGKRVLALSKNYYSDLHPSVHVVEGITRRSLTLPIDSSKNFDFMKGLLSGHFLSDYINNKKQRKCNSMVVSSAIKSYWPCLQGSIGDTF